MEGWAITVVAGREKTPQDFLGGLFLILPLSSKLGAGTGQIPGHGLIPWPKTKFVMLAAMAGTNAGSCQDLGGKRITGGDPWIAADAMARSMAHHKDPMPVEVTSGGELWR